MVDSPRRPSAGYLSSLKYRDFRTLWTASFFAGAAAWALIVARGWLVYQISDSSLWVGIVTFTAMFPAWWSHRSPATCPTASIGAPCWP